MLESCLNIVNPIEARVTKLEEANSSGITDITELSNGITNIQTAVDNNSTAITNVQNTVDGNKSAIETLQSTINTLNTNTAKETSVLELSTKITELESKVDTIIESTEVTEPPLNLALQLAVDKTNVVPYVLSQPTGVGKAFNSVFNINSQALESCNTLAEICTNNEAKSALFTTLQTEKFAIPIYNSTIGAYIDFEVIGYGIDGTNNVTLLPKDVMVLRAWTANSSSAVKYSTSQIRTWLNDTFYNGFDSTIKPLIKQVSKTQNIAGSSTMETTQDYCWLLSVEEVRNSVYTISSLVKNYNGTPVHWWMRSANTSSSALNQIALVYNNGSAENGYSTSPANSYGVVPAIVL